MSVPPRTTVRPGVTITSTMSGPWLRTSGVPGEPQMPLKGAGGWSLVDSTLHAAIVAQRTRTAAEAALREALLHDDDLMARVLRETRP
jgi:hypothetical protein